MFTHLGGSVMIPTDTIVAIIDLKALQQADTEAFLQTAREEGFVVEVAEQAVSMIVAFDNVYLSPISSSTLRLRASERGKQYA